MVYMMAEYFLLVENCNPYGIHATDGIKSVKNPLTTLFIYTQFTYHILNPKQPVNTM